MPSGAHADIVTAGETVAGSFVISGVGNITTGILSLQNDGTQSGSSFVGPGGIPNQSQGNVDTGGNPARTATPLISTLGWSSGADVGIAFAPNQQGSALGITINSLVLTLFNGSTGAALTSFPLASGSSIDFSLVGNPGTANNFFALGLSAGERAQFDAILAQNPDVAIRAGLASTMTGANAGADRLLGFDLADVTILGPSNPALIPLPASLPLFAGGLAFVGLLGWGRKRKSTASVLAA